MEAFRRARTDHGSWRGYQSRGTRSVVRANPAATSDLVGRRLLRTEIVLAALPKVSVPSEQDAFVDAVFLTATGSQAAWTVGSIPISFCCMPACRMIHAGHEHMRQAIFLAERATDVATSAFLSQGAGPSTIRRLQGLSGIIYVKRYGLLW